MLILASASPRRRELLTQAGFSFTVEPADIDESVQPGEEAVAYVTRLALEKAEAVYRLYAARGSAENVQVLGADTTVIVEGAILGKPENAADAARMLRLLSGRAHTVATGVALVSKAASQASAEQTRVEFSPMSEVEIAAYIASGEPMDKAGAYAIQGRAAKWIPRIEGCYFNVVGLPLARVAAMLGNRE
jgi:septum formation protein